MYTGSNFHVFLRQSVLARSRGGFKAEHSQSHPKPPSVSYWVIFCSLLLILSGQIHTKLCKNSRPGEYPGFFLSKCELLRKKTQVLDPCIMFCESRAVHMSRLLRAQVLYFKCRCAAIAVIIEDFSYMHTIGQHGQHKRLSLAREEGDPSKWDAGSGSGLFRHKLSPGYTFL